MNPSNGTQNEPPLGVVVGEGGARIWGMTGAERLRRIFRRAGIAEASGPQVMSGGVVLARADWVLDESLITALAKTPGVALKTPEGKVLAAHVGATRAAAAVSGEGDPLDALADLPAMDLTAAAYNAALRKREPPVMEPLTPQTVRAVEARTFQGSYKGVTDLVTKYVWPRPARVVTRWCAIAGLTPNQVTMAGFILTLMSFWLFWTGSFGWGLACAWVMTFLDTVDGKLARVTMTSSKIGNAFDHGIDLIHPAFWWWAWLVGVQASDHPVAWPGLVLWIVAGGYVVQRLEEGVFLKLFNLEMHAWRPFDSFFRLITARRNPNLILLTLSALALRPDIGLLAVAVWTVICLGVHLAQIVQAMMTPREQVVSWLAR